MKERQRKKERKKERKNETNAFFPKCKKIHKIAVEDDQMLVTR
jgi:hypothetical protein